MREEDSLHFLKAQVKTRNALKADSDGAAQILKEAGAAQKDGAWVYQQTTSRVIQWYIIYCPSLYRFSDHFACL